MAQTLLLDQRQHFLAEGYRIVRNGLPAGLVAETARHLDGLIAALQPGQRPEGLVEPHVVSPDWRFWLELCRHPTVLDRVEECLGDDELLLLMSHLIVKPAGTGMAIAWHQDNTYWPSVEGTDAITVWLAIDEVDLGNSCMKVIPRSHAGYPALEKLPTDGTDLLKVRVEVSAAMEASAVAVELRAGEFSLHDSFIIHGSDANRSPRRRAGYTMRYASAKTVRVDLAKHWVPVHYLRGDGSSMAPGMIDLRPGGELPATPRG